VQYLPENRLFWPPLTVRCVECRTFGRQLLVGVCTVDRLADYEWKDETANDASATSQANVTNCGQTAICSTVYDHITFEKRSFQIHDQ